MLIVGLTGGVATGKSLVAKQLARRGAVVFSADEAARAILSPGGVVLAQIVEAFGARMLLPDGSLDRSRLGHRIFADAEARARLNRITHPPILRLLRAQIDAVRVDLPVDTVAVFEVPLLFETGMQAWFEQIVVVVASQQMQVARLQLRNGLDEEEAERRIDAQWSLAEKVAQADYVLRNDGSEGDLALALDALWDWLTHHHVAAQVA